MRHETLSRANHRVAGAPGVILLACCVLLLFETGVHHGLAGVHPKGPEPSGFDPFIWGQPIPSGHNVEVVEQGGRVTFIRLRNRQLRLGEADIMDALYGFRDGAFHAALLTFRGFTQYRRLREALETMHGSPDERDEYAKRHTWRWEHVRLRLSWDMDTGYGRIEYVYLPLAGPAGWGRDSDNAARCVVSSGQPGIGRLHASTPCLRKSDAEEALRPKRQA